MASSSTPGPSRDRCRRRQRSPGVPSAAPGGSSARSRARSSLPQSRRPDTPPGQGHRTLSAPGHDEGVEGADVRLGERPCRAPGSDGGPAEHAACGPPPEDPPPTPRPRRPRAPPSAVRVDATSVPARPTRRGRRRRPAAGRPCGRALRHPGTERCLREPAGGRRDGPAPARTPDRRCAGRPRAARPLGERGRVDLLPGRARGTADGTGRSTGRHPGQRASAGPAGQAEQDGLGLVVPRVTEQHHRRTESVGRLVERRVTGRASRGLRTPTGPTLHGRDLDGVESERAQHPGDRARAPRILSGARDRP